MDDSIEFSETVLRLFSIEHFYMLMNNSGLNKSIDENLKIPRNMIPRCPKCGAEMEPWVRSWTFLEGKKYRKEYNKLNAFLKANKNKKILFLELGVGRMTPMFIQEPFWQMTRC